MKNNILAAILTSTVLLLAPAAQAAITASDAQLKGNTLTLNIESPESGWAVIHKVSNGNPGAHIGHAMVKQGDNENVEIKLTEPVKEGEHLIVMLHEDKGKKGAFEFGPQSKADVPAMQNGEMVTTTITAE